MNHSHRFLLALLLAAPAAAQTFLYSPPLARTMEQSAYDFVPFWTPTARYQQVHGDHRGSPGPILALSLRRDGAYQATTLATPRTIDLEMFAGNADLRAFSPVFASNWLTPPVRVFNRKTVNLPSFNAHQGLPAPWSLDFPFDTPFPSSALADFAWEMLVHANNNPSFYPMDVYDGRARATGNTIPRGTGCIPSGGTVPTLLQGRVSSAHRFDGSFLEITWTQTGGVASVPGAFLAGTVNPDLVVPGLCTRLYVTPLLVLANGTDAGGTMTTGLLSVPWSPAFPGTTLRAQAVCADAGRADPIPVAATNGLESTLLPLPPPPVPIQRLVANDVNAMTGTHEQDRYGLVVRFRQP